MRSRQLTVYMRSVFEKNYLLGARQATENGPVAAMVFRVYLKKFKPTLVHFGGVTLINFDN